MCVCVCVCVIGHVQLFESPWTVAFQVPLSMGFSRQEYWSGVPLASPSDREGGCYFKFGNQGQMLSLIR